jgi:hypothetical protein
LRGPYLSFGGVEAGVGAAIGFGVEIGTETVGVFDFTGAEVGSGGKVVTGGTKALAGDGAGVCVDVCVGAFGVGVFGAGVFGLGGAPAALTVADDPAGTGTSTPPALVSTVPEIVTTVVSPFGETVT